MKTIKNIILFIPMLLMHQLVSSQVYEVIELNNTSFEEIPHKGGSPNDVGIRGWYSCGELQFQGETPPDIHPINAWEVTMLASEGRTYLGMVVRDNDSWESISQRIKAPIEEGKCYKFSIDLARSFAYVSRSRMTDNVSNYVRPAVLRIYGGTGVCGRQELLAASSTIAKEQWQSYEFEFNPTRTSNYFTIEAFYKTPALIPYNGHLLLDNASSIQRIPCEDEEPFIVQELVIEKKKERNQPKANPKKQIHEERVVPIVEIAQENASQEMLDKQLHMPDEWLETLNGKLSIGQTIPIHNIKFSMDSSNLTLESYDPIEKLQKFLKKNQNVVVEIGGHTSTGPPHSYCDGLSATRAMEVAQQLAKLGIPTQQLYIRGYGKRKPIILNDKFDMAARKINQRVEVKVLSLNYSPTGATIKPKDSKSDQ